MPNPPLSDPLSNGQPVDGPRWNSIFDWVSGKVLNYIGLLANSGAAVSSSGQARLRSNTGGVLEWSEDGMGYRPMAYDRDIREFGRWIPNASDSTSAGINIATMLAAETAAESTIASGLPCRIVVPGGRYFIKDGPTSGLGLKIKGNSANAPNWVGRSGRGDTFDNGTTIQWVGTDNATMVYFESFNKGLVQNIFFHGNSKAGRCCWTGATVYGTATLAASDGYLFENCRFGFVKVGVSGNGAFVVGTDPATTGGLTLESADARWTNCDFYGEDPGAAGFTWAGLAAFGWRTISGGNCKNFVLDHCNFAWAKYGVDWTRASGFLNALSCSFADCMINFSQSDSNLTVIGGDAESGDVTDSRLLSGSGGGSATTAAIFNFQFFSFLAGTTGIAIDWGGNLHLHGVLFGNSNNSVSGGNVSNPFECIVNGGVHSFGNVFFCPYGSGTADYAPFYDGSSNHLAPETASYYGIAASPESWLTSDRDMYAVTTDGTPSYFKACNGNHVRFKQVSIASSLPSLPKGATLAETPEYAGELRRGWMKLTVPYTAFQAAALTTDLNLGDYYPGTTIRRVIAAVTQAFAGPAGTLNLRCGWDSAGDDRVFQDKDVKTAAVRIGDDPTDYNSASGALGSASGLYAGICPNRSSNWFLKTRLTSSSGNLSSLSAGSVTFYVELETL